MCVRDSRINTLIAGAVATVLSVCILTISVMPQPSLAEDEHPAMEIIRALVTEIKNNSQQALDNPDQKEEYFKKSFDLIDGAVHWDSFLKLVFGREWLKLTPEQQGNLGDGLKRLISRAYVRTFDKFVDYRVEYLRVDKSPRADIVSVVLKVYPPDGSETILLQSRMRLKEDKWLSFDFITNGISISSAYKSNYRKALKDKGYEQLASIIDNTIANQNQSSSKIADSTDEDRSDKNPEPGENSESGKKSE